MTTTYPAIIRGDTVEWIESRPEVLDHSSEGVEVVISIPREQPLTSHRGNEMAAILEEISRLPGRRTVTDAAAWEREIRADRPLPGREP